MALDAKQRKEMSAVEDARRRRQQVIDVLTDDLAAAPPDELRERRVGLLDESGGIDGQKSARRDVKDGVEVGRIAPLVRRLRHSKGIAGWHRSSRRDG